MFSKQKRILPAAAVFCASLMPAAAFLSPAASVFASEETSSAADDFGLSEIYQIGDAMDDFTVTTSDGEELTLSELLETREAVVLNFWFSTCQPCAMEFPFLEEAYEEYQDKLEVIAITPYDDDDTINSYKEEKGLTFPMAQDTAGLCDQFLFDGFPTTIIIDRFGTVCFLESGSQPSTYAFESLFSAYTGDDYTESLLDYQIPPQKPDCTMPPAEEVAASLNAEGGSLTFSALDDEYSWPWLLKEDDGRTVACASNSGIGNSYADLCTTVSAKAGDALSFDYKVSAEDGTDFFTISVDNEVVKVFSGDRDWSSYAYRFEEDGDYTVTFSYQKDDAGDAYDDTVLLDNVQLLSGEDADAAVNANPVYPTAKEHDAIEITPAEEAREIVFYDQEDGTLSQESSDLLESYFGSGSSFYLFPSGTAGFTIQLGSDYDPDGAFYYCNYDGSMGILTSCDYDEDGYHVSCGIDTTAETGYSNSSFALYPLFNDFSVYYPVALFASEAELNQFCQADFLDNNFEPVEGFSWKYADGELPSSDALPTIGTEEVSDSAAFVSYQIIFKDQNGEPVPGVVANVCDDSTCSPMTADDDGVISFEMAPFAYAIHVLKVPDGYEFDTTQEFTAEENGGVLEITVTKK